MLSVETGGYMSVLPSRVEDITRSQHLWLTEAALRQYETEIFISDQGKKPKKERRVNYSLFTGLLKHFTLRKCNI